MNAMQDRVNLRDVEDGDLVRVSGVTQPSPYFKVVRVGDAIGLQSGRSTSAWWDALQPLQPVPFLEIESESTKDDVCPR